MRLLPSCTSASFCWCRRFFARHGIHLVLRQRCADSSGPSRSSTSSSPDDACGSKPLTNPILRTGCFICCCRWQPTRHCSRRPSPFTFRRGRPSSQSVLRCSYCCLPASITLGTRFLTSCLRPSRKRATRDADSNQTKVLVLYRRIVGGIDVDHVEWSLSTDLHDARLCCPREVVHSGRCFGKPTRVQCCALRFVELVSHPKVKLTGNERYVFRGAVVMGGDGVVRWHLQANHEDTGLGRVSRKNR